MADMAQQKPAESAHLYRYRTPALVGPWRKSESHALRDALRARQALRDERDRDSVRWLVPGEIEATEARAVERATR